MYFPHGTLQRCYNLKRRKGFQILNIASIRLPAGSTTLCLNQQKKRKKVRAALL